jgi:hypothetical protein
MIAVEALARFDGPVTIESMFGHWRGGEVPTGHVMDGLLSAYAWHGKSFFDAETVHPLVFRDWQGQRVSLDPRWMPLGLARYRWLAHSVAMRGIVRLIRPLLETRAPRARLRAMEHRGVVTATMIYDHLPICDHFRRLDDDRLLGLMDLRGAAPFFFTLTREAA